VIQRNGRWKPLSERDTAAATDAARCVVETHRRLSGWLAHGVTLAEVDRFVADQLADLGARSCFLGYRAGKGPAFPSHACLSVNDCVVHGTAGAHLDPMRPGDVLKVDIGVSLRGWIGDAAWTYSFGEPEPEVARLMACGKRSILLGIEALRPGAPLLDWASAVQGHVEGECGFHLIRGLGGHGYGRKLHGPPFVSNTVPVYPGEWPDAHTRIQPGMLLAVEPMIAIGTGRVSQVGSEWPMRTVDGSQCVHYEHDVLITDDGPVVLTDGLDEVGDVITR